MNEQLKKLEVDVLRRIKEDSEKKYENPLDRLKSNSDKSLKYSNILYRLKKKLNRMTMEVRKKYGELHKHYKMNSNYLLKNKQDVEAFINTDDNYFKLKSELKEIQNLVDLVEITRDIYKDKEYTERLLAKSHIEGG